MNDLRPWLYPFGFLSSLAFGARFLVQWLQSEKEKKSLSPLLFWKLSITGNLLLFTHCLIQQHYPMSLAQGVNAVLAWRNCNLMQKKDKQLPLNFVWAMIASVVIATTLFFCFQDAWLRSAHFYWTTPQEQVPLWLHVAGIFGIFCYSLRFWIQWLQAESTSKSELPLSFWWLSIIGSLFCTLYFSYLFDWVNLIGPLVSFVPFGRNLWMKYRAPA